MHIQCINTEIVRGQVDTLKHFPKCEVLAVPKEYVFIWTLLHLAFNKSQEMLLVHAGRMMDMCINLSYIVEIPMRNPLCVCSLLVLVKKSI